MPSLEQVQDINGTVIIQACLYQFQSPCCLNLSIIASSKLHGAHNFITKEIATHSVNDRGMAGPVEQPVR